MEDQEKRRTSFDNIAKLYDEVRPQYPSALIDDVIQKTSYKHPDLMLEVGCGTGKASIMFAEKDCQIVAIEPGRTLAEITRNKLADYPSCTVKVANFEDWEAPNNKFKVVYAAQSFHWIKPEVKYQKSADLLTEDGWLALFWHNKSSDDSQIR